MWLTRLELSMTGVSDEKRWAYVTHADIRSIPHYKDSTLLLIKAPPNTQLTVPPPTEGLQMHMKSDGGEIGVFLCPETEAGPANQIALGNGIYNGEYRPGFILWLLALHISQFYGFVLHFGGYS